MEIEVSVKPWVGRYPFPAFVELTTLEWRTIKQLSGYLPLTLDAGIEGGDPEVMTVMAVVAMCRAGRIGAADAAATYERLLDQVASDVFDVHFGAEEEVDGDSPPPTSTGASSASSGGGTKTSSAPSAQTRNGSGTPASATSPLPPVRSGI